MPTPPRASPDAPAGGTVTIDSTVTDATVTIDSTVTIAAPAFVTPAVC